MAAKKAKKSAKRKLSKLELSIRASARRLRKVQEIKDRGDPEELRKLEKRFEAIRRREEKLKFLSTPIYKSSLRWRD